MRIKQDSEVQSVVVDMPGAKDVTMQILIGVDDGSNRIIQRLFTVAPGGHTPHHTHGFEHLVRIESGRGAAIDADGQAQPLAVGQSVFVPADEPHQFRNTGDGPFVFTCTIPNPNSLA